MSYKVGDRIPCGYGIEAIITKVDTYGREPLYSVDYFFLNEEITTKVIAMVEEGHLFFDPDLDDYPHHVGDYEFIGYNAWLSDKDFDDMENFCWAEIEPDWFDDDEEYWSD